MGSGGEGGLSSALESEHQGLGLYKLQKKLLKEHQNTLIEQF